MLYFFVPNSISISKIERISKTLNKNNGIIIFKNQFLKEQWKYFAKNEALRPAIVTGSKLINTIIFIYFIIKAKFSQSTVVIFHECCWEILDLMILYLKPKIVYFPEYILGKNYQEIKPEEANSKKIKLLSKLPATNRFRHYRRKLDREFVYGEVSSASDYYEEFKGSIEKSEKRQIKGNRALLLLGTTVLDKEEEIYILTKTIDMLYSSQIDFVVKDHPNPIFRTDASIFNFHALDIIDPLIPLEALTNEYGVALSIGSTGVNNFDEGILLFALHRDVSPDIKDFENHLALNKSDNTMIVRSFDELLAKIKNLKIAN